MPGSPQRTASCHRDEPTPMSTASLFAIIRKQKQSRGTLAEGGMVKMCRVYMMECWAAGKKSEMCRGRAVPGKYNVT